MIFFKTKAAISGSGLDLWLHSTRVLLFVHIFVVAEYTNEAT